MSLFGKIKGTLSLLKDIDIEAIAKLNSKIDLKEVMEERKRKMEELKQEIEDLEEENRQLEETIRGILDDF